jgi:hypothetical protein
MRRLWPIATVFAATMLVVGPLVTVAQSDPAVEVPAPFEGFIPCPSYWEDGNTTNVVLGSVEGGNLVRRETRGAMWRVNHVEMSDPRVSGTYTAYFDYDEYITPQIDIEDCPGFFSGLLTLEGETGGWRGSWVDMGWAESPYDADQWTTIVLSGRGAHEGLTAMLAMRFAEETCGWDVQGIVFEGAMPPVPDAPDA